MEKEIKKIDPKLFTFPRYGVWECIFYNLDNENEKFTAPDLDFSHIAEYVEPKDLVKIGVDDLIKQIDSITTEIESSNYSGASTLIQLLDEYVSEIVNQKS